MVSGGERKKGRSLGLLLRLWVGGRLRLTPEERLMIERALERKWNCYMLCFTRGNSLSSIWAFSWPLVLSWGLAIHVP